MTPRIVPGASFTGGPGVGKTAVLELVRQSLCRHVRLLPESAGIVFGGGFPRPEDEACRRAAQRSIFHVQRQLEASGDAHDAAVVLCDRGTIDGLAYWPPPAEEFWLSTGASLQSELQRYDVVLHLRTPTPEQGYNWRNPLRTESSTDAGAIDARIAEAWASHPRRHQVEATMAFPDKAVRAHQILRAEMPSCCASHLPDLDPSATSTA